MDLRKLANEYTDSVKLMQLATVNNGQPWICSVFFTVDEDLNFYWTSGRDRQHSVEILSDPKSAITIVKDVAKKQAMQLSGMAEEVKDEDLEAVHKLYQSKFGPKDYDLEEMKKRQPNDRAYWVFRPKVIMFWDEVNFPNEPKQVLALG